MSTKSASREHIITAFLQLCEAMPYNKITVSQLIKKAGYNRSTFYSHFKSIDALMQELQKYVMQVPDEILPYGLKILYTGIITDEQLRLFQKILHQSLPILTMLLGPHGNPLFVHHFKEHIHQKIVALLGLKQDDLTPQLTLMLEFIISGHLQLLLYYYKNKPEITPLDFWMQIRSCIDKQALLSVILAKTDKIR